MWEPEATALGPSLWWAHSARHAHLVSCAHRGVIKGASVSHYLLETSRVVFQVRATLLPTPSQLPEWERERGCGPRYCSPKPALLPKAQAERSFHVFYELLAGLDPMEQEQLSLQGPETYYYLNQVGARPWCCGGEGPPRQGSQPGL
jgi:hypothetical protein